jgi:hypothetical protein
MKRFLITTLALANIVALVVLFSILSTGHATQLTFDDLSYGAMDVDGDGRYTEGDDSQVEWILQNQPAVLKEALKTAKLNQDGGVDLSPFLMQFGLNDGTITLWRDGRVVTESVEQAGN